MTFKNFAIAIMAFFCVAMLASCEDSDSTKGSVQVEMTDAPIDDANVSGAFVTVTDVKIGGQSLEGFNKTTFDLMAYQNGSTKLLGNAEFDARSYSNVTLVLDYDTDANGNAPGCYIQMVNGEKAKLESTANEIQLSYAMTVAAEAQSNIVLDFDLRKCLAREQAGSDNYNFVTTAELQSGIRVVAKESTGTIKGSCSDGQSNAEKIVVYAYKRGEFNANTETQASGASEIEFSNAVTSAVVDANGNYSLNFLEEGNYECVFYGYEDTNSDGQFEIAGKLTFNLVTQLLIENISVGASAEASVNVNVTGIIP